MATTGTTEQAYVTLATNNYYAHGVLALGESLRKTGTQRNMVAMLTEGVSEDMRIRIGRHWNVIKIIEEMNSGDVESLSLIKRPELGITFSKLHAWRLEEYTKCVFLDADTLVLENIDELFEREEFSAAPDIGWPDLFNSGVFVMKPSITTYTELVDLAKTEGSYDGGDQGLLNTYWNQWSVSDSKNRLPFIYNVVANLTYSYPPAIKRFFDKIKIIHFLGSVKPWVHHYDQARDEMLFHPSVHPTQYGAESFVKKWWQMYCSSFPTEDEPKLISPSSSSDVGVVISNDIVSIVPSAAGSGESDDTRRKSWESGKPDYHGADQSDNIIAHINAQLNLN